jgi:hypothetical protein
VPGEGLLQHLRGRSVPREDLLQHLGGRSVPSRGLLQPSQVLLQPTRGEQLFSYVDGIRLVRWGMDVLFRPDDHAKARPPARTQQG